MLVKVWCVKRVSLKSIVGGWEQQQHLALAESKGSRSEGAFDGTEKRFKLEVDLRHTMETILVSWPGVKGIDIDVPFIIKNDVSSRIQFGIIQLSHVIA